MDFFQSRWGSFLLLCARPIFHLIACTWLFLFGRAATTCAVFCTRRASNRNLLFMPHQHTTNDIYNCHHRILVVELYIVEAGIKWHRDKVDPFKFVNYISNVNCQMGKCIDGARQQNIVLLVKSCNSIQCYNWHSKWSEWRVQGPSFSCLLLNNSRQQTSFSSDSQQYVLKEISSCLLDSQVKQNFLKSEHGSSSRRFLPFLLWQNSNWFFNYKSRVLVEISI